MSANRLFSPIRIGPLELRNRLVMAPMTTGYGTRDGLPSAQLTEYLVARARGGVGLITLEACTVDRRHREVPRSMHFSSDDVIAAHRELTDRIHAHGAAVAPQIVHPGPDGLAPFLERIPSVGPSVIPSYLTGVPSRELDPDEIESIVSQFGAAARRVREAGYDALELHAAHGYMLLGSFLSPVRNRRTDRFAGNTSDGRLEIVRLVLRAIRDAAGADFPVTLRISGYERVAGGRAIDDTQRIAPRLVGFGVDAFHVSGGAIDRLTSHVVTGSHLPDGLNVAAAAAVKRVVDVPVMVVGRIHDVALAERILQRGHADLVAMARPLLADPELPEKARSRRNAAIRRCISCQNCIDSMEVGEMNCAVNAFSGREGARRIHRTERPKRVLIVGSGPAGLEAARVAASCGHRVTLVEQHRQLGGALRAAATVHAENAHLLRFLTGQVRGLDVRLGERVEPGCVDRYSADAIIVATGGRLAAPRITGDRLPHVWHGASLRALLAGVPGEYFRRIPAPLRAAARRLGPTAAGWMTPERARRLARVWLPFGDRVVIVGADLAALELAEFLAGCGREVALLGPDAEIAPEIGPKRRTEQLDRLDRAGVVVNTALSIDAITRDAVAFSVDGVSRRAPADSVIVAGRLEADTTLFDALAARRSEVFAIGDCTGLGLIRKATDDATRVASSL